MKVPIHWLKDYVDIDISIADLAERLTLAGLELDGTQVFGVPIPDGLRVKEEDRGPVWDRDKIFVGEIVRVDKHPDADRLSMPTVAYGEGREQTLVTGAPNVKVGDQGQKVVVALSGSVLFDGHSDEPVLKKLKPTKIRGVPSEAMVCSFKELGIADEHEGIIILEDDAPVGTPLADFMGDVVLDLDVLPNMARCLSMIGVAREVAAITSGRLKYPNLEFERSDESVEGQVKVEIENSDLSARYAAMLIKEVTIGPAPGWMQRRLRYAGMRPISNIVDITNFVMLEWGQPLHAFDFDLLVERAGGKTPVITVRPACDGEMLVTLDGNKRELSSDDLVIADAKGPIALAGVMGGAETEVTDKTKNILLESASFDFVSIRRTMRKFDLPSEASARFSRGIHPETVKPAAERASQLMAKYADGKVCQGIVDEYPAPLPPQEITLDMHEAKRILGIELPVDDAMRILQALEFEVRQTGPDTLQATTPPHRRDIQVGVVDLLEDLARIYGYDRLPATLLADRLPGQATNKELVFEDRLRNLLVRAGLQEVITYSLTTPAKEAPLLGITDAERDYIRLLNPISSEREVMRQTILSSVLDIASHHLRNNFDDVRLFEIGFTFFPHEEAKLPDEPRRLSIVLYGRRDLEFWRDSGSTKSRDELDFFDLKGVVEAMATDLHLPSVTYRLSKAPYLHPAEAATLLTKDQALGDFGQLHPKVAEQYGLATRKVFVAEFDVDALQQAVPDRFRCEPVPRFPAALRDIAVVVDESVAAEQLEREIRSGGGELLRGVQLFDVYRGGNLPQGRKSLAYALTYQSDEKTLTDKEVDKAHRKIEERLKKTLQAQIRGKE